METFYDQLRRIPFIKVLVPIIAGILLHEIINLDSNYILGLLGLIFIITVVSTFITKLTGKYAYKWYVGILFNFIFLFAGYLITDLQNYKVRELDNIDSETKIMACIYESPVQKQNSYKSIVEIVAAKKESEWIACSGKAILYFEKDSVIGLLEIGDLICIQGGLRDIEPPKNPNEFDYRRYLLRNYIAKQAYVPSTNWEFQTHSKKFAFVAFFQNIRELLLNIYKENGIKGDEFAIASALTLGYKDVMNKDLAGSYSSAGAMHVLAVSGLHVGIIYLILSYLFFFLNKKKISRILKAIVILILLWSYAMITGLSPSVLRATTMFSFIVIAEVVNRKTNIYNTLAASAVCLLLYDPNMISAVGFQLSYLAVLSIVFFQPRFYKLWYFKNKILDKIWALFTVSVAAQIGTAPISIYYFNQFPNLFFITNLIVIPLATIILCLGMAVLLFSFIPVISSFFADLLAYSIKALNYSVVWIEKVPFSVTSGIYFNEYSVIVLYVVVVITTLFFINKKAIFLKYALSLIVLMTLFSSYNSIKQLGKKEIVVYHSQGSSVYNFIDGKIHYVVTDIEEPKDLHYCAKNNWTVKGLDEEIMIDMEAIYEKQAYSGLYLNNGFISFCETTFFVLGPEVGFAKDSMREPVKVDYVILRGDPEIPLKKLKSKISFDKIIFDSSNSYWYVDEKKTEFDSLAVDYINTMESGAFIINIK